MSLVTLSLGSNIDPASNIRQAVSALQDRYRDIRLSPVYESEAVGFSGDNFLNLVLAMEVDVGPAALLAELKSLEKRQGRDHGAESFAARTLDLDVLTFADLQGEHAGMQLPRAEITRYAFVLRPLADLLPELRHPVLGRTYRQLWESFQQERGESQRLWPVPFDWQGAVQD